MRDSSQQQLSGTSCLIVSFFINRSDGNESIAKVELDAGNYALIPCTFGPDQESAFAATIFSSSIRFEDDKTAFAADDDEDAVAVPASAQAATPELELFREKKAHMDTLSKASALQSELEQLRMSYFRLQDEVKALQSGAGNAASSSAAVVDPVLMSQLVQELTTASEAKRGAILAKIQATLSPSSSSASSSAAQDSDAAAADHSTITTTPQTGKKVAVYDISRHLSTMSTID